MDDDKLLTQYVRDGSEAAFGQLVARHLNLVYAICLRELASSALAEDAAQVVFLLLARKAKTLRPAPSLVGWFFHTARFVAKDVRKQEARRQRREQIVMQEMTQQQESPAPSWEQVEPLLNDALAALKPTEREAVLLRFFESHSLAETGAVLALSEDAARMRVSRAVEKMRRYLTAHGAAITGIVLTGLLTSEAARPAPTHAANVITHGTLQAISSGSTANVSQLLEGVYQTMKITKVKFAAVVGVLVLGGTALVPLAHALSTHYNAAHHYAYSGAASAWVGPRDRLGINATGKVPGDPALGLSEAEHVYKDIQLYRDRHQGDFPPDGSVLRDARVRNLKAYGYPDFLSALRAYCNPDSRYADDPVARREPAATETFMLLKHRMDGTPIGSNKQAGTRDVLAYSDTYYHENIHRHGLNRDTISPAGFYIVVWDDGEIQEVPFERTSYVKQPDGFMLVFPGQTGITADAIPYKAFWATLLHS